MKELDIKRMKLADINERIGICASTDELQAIIDTNDEQFLQQFMENLNGKEDLYQYIESQIKGDETKVNKVSLIMITLKNYLKSYMNVIKTIGKNNQGSLEDRNKGQQLINRYIKEAKEILKDIDKTIYMLKFNPLDYCFIEALNSQEIVTGKKREQNKKKLEVLRSRGLDLGDIANSIVLTDLIGLVADVRLGTLMRYQAFHNTATKKGIKEEKGMFFNPEDKIDALRDQMAYEEMLPEVAKILEDNIEYIDFDKLLLCSAYRHIEFLEANAYIDEDSEEEVERRLRIIQEYLKGKNVKIQGRIEKQNYEGEDEFEYVDILYKVKDFERDMQKYRGKTYYGKARVDSEKKELLSGEVQFRDLEFKDFKLNTEETISVATANDDNYLYLIENGLINSNAISRVNEDRKTLPIKCLQALIEKQEINGKEAIEFYLQGKVDLESISSLELDLKDDIEVEDVYLEFSKENNEDRQNRISELYKKIFLEQQEGKTIEDNKQKILEAYLNSLDARYLEIFLNLGALDFEDVDGFMTAAEWMEALERKEISEELFFELQKNKIIAVEDVKENEKMLANELKLWEAGVVSSEQIGLLGLSIDELLRMCDDGKITGKRIHELLHDEEERDRVRKQIKSNYVYGFFDTIRPALACYNNNLINRDNAVALIKGMKTQEQEIVYACTQGVLSGEKIAELYYQHIISKKAFSEIKKMGLVTDEEEISVLNNLTPEEMISELEKNGCEQIVNIEEIIRESTATKGNITRNGKGAFCYRKQVINPMARNKLLELLGADKIVTTPEQGFKGYQVYLIPKLNIAVMEKMFRLDKDKNVKPAYGDATYICELGKFLMVAGQSKQEIRAFMDVEGSENGRVEIIEHRKNWGKKLIDAIAKVNSEISVQENKNVQQISNNGREIAIDIQKVNELIEQIRQGDYSLDLEDYE